MKRKGFLVSFLVLITIGLFVFYSSNLVSAQSKAIELKYSSPYMPPIPYAVAAQNWMKYVEEKTNNRVHFSPYWGGTLLTSRECISELSKGTADVALCSVFTEKGYEITWAMGTFVWNSPSPEVTYRACREVYEKTPSFKQEFPGLMVLAYRNPFEYFLFTKKPINKIEDLKGLTVCSGAPGTTIFPPLGAQVVKIPPPEWYANLEKGIISSIFIQLETLEGYKLAEVIKYVNMDIMLPNAAIPMTFMNQKSFEKLPPDIQKVFIESMDFFEKEQTKIQRQAQQSGVEFGKKKGVQFINLPEVEKEKWRKAVETAVQEDIKKVNAAGKPGMEIYKAVQEAIKRHSR